MLDAMHVPVARRKQAVLGQAVVESVRENPRPPRSGNDGETIAVFSVLREGTQSTLAAAG
jgi:hypothetical protein